MATKAARYAAQERYRKKTLRQYALRAHKEYDADIIAYLDSQENITGTLKRLIREDIKRNGNGE